MFKNSQKGSLKRYGLPATLDFKTMEAHIFGSNAIAGLEFAQTARIRRAQYAIKDQSTPLPADIMDDIHHQTVDSTFAFLAKDLINTAKGSSTKTDVTCRLWIMLQVLKGEWKKEDTDRVTIASVRNEIGEWSLIRKRIGSRTAAAPKINEKFSAEFDDGFDVEAMIEQLYDAGTTAERIALLKTRTYTDWHAIIFSMPWDDASFLDVPEWIISQKDCDQATALELLMLLSPIQFEDADGAIDTLPPYQQRYYDLARTTHAQLIQGFYIKKTIEIVHDSKHQLTNMKDKQEQATMPDKWFLPNDMFSYYNC